MSELLRFAKMCQEEMQSESSWLKSFSAEWIDSDGHGKFRLGGKFAMADVEWSSSTGFWIRVIGPSILYYESCRSVRAAEEALGRVSTLLCGNPEDHGP